MQKIEDSFHQERVPGATANPPPAGMAGVEKETFETWNQISVICTF